MTVPVDSDGEKKDIANEIEFFMTSLAQTSRTISWPMMWFGHGTVTKVHSTSKLQSEQRTWDVKTARVFSLSGIHTVIVLDAVLPSFPATSPRRSVTEVFLSECVRQRHGKPNDFTTTIVTLTVYQVDVRIGAYNSITKGQRLAGSGWKTPRH